MKKVISILIILALFSVIFGAFAEDILQKGSKGDEVKQLQLGLIGQGYLSGKADGDFGKMTESALIAFQTDNGLEATGIADLQTIELLNAKETERRENIVLAKGDSGTEVQAVQERLIQLGYLFGKADGKYNDSLETAVIMFQRRNGLDETGTVDKEVQAAMYADNVVEASRANVIIPQNVKVNMHYSYPYLQVGFKNNGSEKVDAVDFRFKVYNSYGERLCVYDNIYSCVNEEERTTFQYNGTINAGGTAKMTRKQEASLGSFRSNDGEKIDLVKVAVSRYHAVDGGAYDIPEDEWIWYGSDGSVEMSERNPNLATSEITPEIQELTDKMEIGLEKSITLKDYLAEVYGMPYGGLFIDEYPSNGIFKDAGIEHYDVITTVDGYAVYTLDDLIFALGKGAADGNVDVTYYRDKKEQSTSINTSWYVDDGGTSVLTENEDAQNEQKEQEDKTEKDVEQSVDEASDEATSPEEAAEEAPSKVVSIPGGEYTIGEDIPAGSYRITIKNGYTNFQVWGAAVQDYDTNGGFLLGIGLDASEDNESVLGKVTLEEGNVIQFEKTLDFEVYKGIQFVENEMNNIPGGIYTIGEDIPQGDYSISIKNGYTNLQLWGAAFQDYDSNGGYILGIGLDASEDGESLIGKITLEEGNVIEFEKGLVFESYEGIHFIEGERNVVPGGVYTVGEDIPEGNYKVSIEKGYTNLQVWGEKLQDYDRNGGLILGTSLDASVENEKELGKVSLKQGNVVVFSKELIFEPSISFSF